MNSNPQHLTFLVNLQKAILGDQKQETESRGIIRVETNDRNTEVPEVVVVPAANGEDRMVQPLPANILLRRALRPSRYVRKTDRINVANAPKKPENPIAVESWPESSQPPKRNRKQLFKENDLNKLP